MLAGAREYGRSPSSSSVREQQSPLHRANPVVEVLRVLRVARAKRQKHLKFHQVQSFCVRRRAKSEYLQTAAMDIVLRCVFLPKAARLGIEGERVGIGF